MSKQAIAFVLIGLCSYLLVSNLTIGAVADLVPVKSSEDKTTYMVLDKPRKQEVADLLAKVRAQAEKITDELIAQKPKLSAAEQQAVNRLANKRPFNLIELDSSREHTIAYNNAKGEEIFLCTKNGSRLADQDVLLSVLLHELAHSMEANVSPMKNGYSVHSEEFRAYERLLNSTASSLDLLSPTAVIGRNHCGISIPNPDSAQ